MAVFKEYFGRRFTLDKKTGYYLSSNQPRVRAHRWVWENHFGAIPKGYHIHHKDEDKSNNEISNLKLVTPSEHQLLHMSPERSAAQKEWADKIRPMTKEWHRSAEGRAWHKFHALRSGFANRPYVDYTCQQCQTSYKSKNSVAPKFCSNNCKSQWRRDVGLDNIERKCEGCSANFLVNKYSKKYTCNKVCAAIARKLRHPIA